MKRTFIKRKGFKSLKVAEKAIRDLGNTDAPTYLYGVVPKGLPQKRLKRRISPTRGTKKRRRKGEITKLKDQLWFTMRQLAALIYKHECYTCNTRLVWGSAVMQLGHFLPKASCSVELKFDIKNTRWQCRFCNQFRNDWPQYEDRLIREHGIEYVNELKERNRATKGLTYSKDWFTSKISEYQTILTNLKNPTPAKAEE